MAKRGARVILACRNTQKAEPIAGQAVDDQRDFIQNELDSSK
jgi:hypothetical protein